VADETARRAPERDRFAGCLVGQAFPDALGFVVEGYGPEECAAYVRTTLVPRRLSGHGRGRFPLGQYSDDTQLARELSSTPFALMATAHNQFRFDTPSRSGLPAFSRKRKTHTPIQSGGGLGPAKPQQPARHGRGANSDARNAP